MEQINLKIPLDGEVSSLEYLWQVYTYLHSILHQPQVDVNPGIIFLLLYRIQSLHTKQVYCENFLNDHIHAAAPCMNKIGHACIQHDYIHFTPQLLQVSKMLHTKADLQDFFSLSCTTTTTVPLVSIHSSLSRPFCVQIFHTTQTRFFSCCPEIMLHTTRRFLFKGAKFPSKIKSFSSLSPSPFRRRPNISPVPQQILQYVRTLLSMIQSAFPNGRGSELLDRLAACWVNSERQSYLLELYY